MRIWAILRSSLIVAHTIGVLVAGIAAVFEIKTILWSGPILACTGLLLAILSYRARCRIGFGFGLTAPVAALAWFLTINGLKWGPNPAHLPVSVFLIIFALMSVPGSVFCVFEAFSPHAGANHRFQFSIRAMLAITFLLALYLGILRALDVFGRLSSLWLNGSIR